MWKSEHALGYRCYCLRVYRRSNVSRPLALPFSMWLRSPQKTEECRVAKDRVGEIVEVRLLEVIRIVSDDIKQKKSI